MHSSNHLFLVYAIRCDFCLNNVVIDYGLTEDHILCFISLSHDFIIFSFPFHICSMALIVHRFKEMDYSSQCLILFKT